MPLPQAGWPATHRRRSCEATASARATPASTPTERSMTCATGSTPSAYHTLPFTNATRATWPHPPSRCVHCSSSVGLSAEDGGGNRRIAEEPRFNACAPWAVRGQSRKVARPCRGRPSRTCALGCCHVPQNTSALCRAPPIACNPRPPSSCQSTPVTRVCPRPPGRPAHTRHAGGFSQASNSSGMSSDNT